MRKIDQDGIGVRFEAARQNMFEWYEAKYGTREGLGTRIVRNGNGDRRGSEWIPKTAQAYFEACRYYEHRSICSIVCERFARRVLFVKVRLQGLFR